MNRQILYRNARARGLLELFLVSAATGLLGVRFYLYLTGYPQVGNGTLHIAHMLWGGLLMLAAQVLLLAFLGKRVQRAAAILGGIGFGIFIDELGKFITRDNNYFFRPTIGIIYAIFIALYLLFNFLGRSQRLTEREYHLNALMQLEEAVEQDLDPNEKRQVQELLAKTDARNPITKQLTKFLESVETVPLERPSWLRRTLDFFHRRYQKFWRRRNSNGVVRAFFIAEAVLFLLGVTAAAYVNLGNIRELFSGNSSYGTELLIGQLISSGVAAGFVLYGAWRLRHNRADAFEQFRRATLINLFLTEFFIFSRIQFGALPSFIFNLVLLGLISYARTQEHRTIQSREP